MHSGDQPSNMDQWMRRIEAQLGQLDQRVRGVGLPYASSDQTVVTDGTGQVTIPFGVTFTTAPVVTVVGAAGELVTYGAVTTSGITVTFSAADGSGPLASTSLRVIWYALPPTS